MGNVVREINKEFTYAQIVERIQAVTGRVFSEGHIGNVARGAKPLSDGLRYNLMLAFPEFFLPLSSPDGAKLQRDSERRLVWSE